MIAGPVTGGIIVGIIMFFWRREARPGGVADVIEARTHEGKKLSLRNSLVATTISAISLGFGASAGREGPVVYFAASVSKSLFRFFRVATFCASHHARLRCRRGDFRLV